LSRAAELGNVDAHAKLGMMYEMGRGVEEDEKKAVYHDEKAAIGGHPQARYNLACIEEENGNIERAVKHHMIAANLGHDQSMKALWKHYSAENITKEDLDATLRTHQAAINAMKSAQRDAAEIVWKNI
jgi:TPR repeat protein